MIVSFKMPQDVYLDPSISKAINITWQIDPDIDVEGSNYKFTYCTVYYKYHTSSVWNHVDYAPPAGQQEIKSYDLALMSNYTIGGKQISDFKEIDYKIDVEFTFIGKEGNVVTGHETSDTCIVIFKGSTQLAVIKAVSEDRYYTDISDEDLDFGDIEESTEPVQHDWDFNENIPDERFTYYQTLDLNLPFDGSKGFGYPVFDGVKEPKYSMRVRVNANKTGNVPLVSLNSPLAGDFHINHSGVTKALAKDEPEFHYNTPIAYGSGYARTYYQTYQDIYDRQYYIQYSIETLYQYNPVYEINTVYHITPQYGYYHTYGSYDTYSGPHYQTYTFEELSNSALYQSHNLYGVGYKLTTVPGVYVTSGQDNMGADYYYQEKIYYSNTDFKSRYYYTNNYHENIYNHEHDVSYTITFDTDYYYYYTSEIGRYSYYYINRYGTASYSTQGYGDLPKNYKYYYSYYTITYGYTYDCSYDYKPEYNQEYAYYDYTYSIERHTQKLYYYYIIDSKPASDNYYYKNDVPKYHYGTTYAYDKTYNYDVKRLVIITDYAPGGYYYTRYTGSESSIYNYYYYYFTGEYSNTYMSYQAVDHYNIYYTYSASRVYYTGRGYYDYVTAYGYHITEYTYYYAYTYWYNYTYYDIEWTYSYRQGTWYENGYYWKNTGYSYYTPRSAYTRRGRLYYYNERHDIITYYLAPYSKQYTYYYKKVESAYYYPVNDWKQGYEPSAGAVYLMYWMYTWYGSASYNYYGYYNYYYAIKNTNPVYGTFYSVTSSTKIYGNAADHYYTYYTYYRNGTTPQVSEYYKYYTDASYYYKEYQYMKYVLNYYRYITHYTFEYTAVPYTYYFYYDWKRNDILDYYYYNYTNSSQQYTYYTTYYYNYSYDYYTYSIPTDTRKIEGYSYDYMYYRGTYLYNYGTYNYIDGYAKAYQSYNYRSKRVTTYRYNYKYNKYIGYYTVEYELKPISSYGVDTYYAYNSFYTINATHFYFYTATYDMLQVLTTTYDYYYKADEFMKYYYYISNTYTDTLNFYEYTGLEYYIKNTYPRIDFYYDEFIGYREDLLYYYGYIEGYLVHNLGLRSYVYFDYTQAVGHIEEYTYYGNNIHEYQYYYYGYLQYGYNAHPYGGYYVVPEILYNHNYTNIYSPDAYSYIGEDGRYAVASTIRSNNLLIVQPYINYTTIDKIKSFYYGYYNKNIKIYAKGIYNYNNIYNYNYNFTYQIPFTEYTYYSGGAAYYYYGIGVKAYRGSKYVNEGI